MCTYLKSRLKGACGPRDFLTFLSLSFRVHASAKSSGERRLVNYSRNFSTLRFVPRKSAHKYIDWKLTLHFASLLTHFEVILEKMWRTTLLMDYPLLSFYFWHMIEKIIEWENSTLRFSWLKKTLELADYKVKSFYYSCKNSQCSELFLMIMEPFFTE